MSTDPLQLLIDAGAIPATPFDASSRYNGLPLALHTPRPDAAPVAHVTRRFMPRQDSIASAAEHLVRAGERPDTLAALTLGDPLLYWRLADANGVLDPNELTATLGRRVRVPLPPGLPGPQAD